MAPVVLWEGVENGVEDGVVKAVDEEILLEGISQA